MKQILVPVCSALLTMSLLGGKKSLVPDRYP